jgi:uncharacterized Rmd1/YagE family protein
MILNSFWLKAARMYFKKQRKGESAREGKKGQKALANPAKDIYKLYKKNPPASQKERRRKREQNMSRVTNWGSHRWKRWRAG